MEMQQIVPEKTEAIITVVGQDKVGILASISTVCAQNGVNVEEVTQSILRDTFAMIMVADISRSKVNFSILSQKLKTAGEELGVQVTITRQEIFDAMYHV